VLKVPVLRLKFDSSGNAYGVYGFAGDPATRDTVFKDSTFGQLYKFDTNAGTATSIADLSAYELANNPDGGDVVSNPYALARRYCLSLMGANTLLSVALDGSGVTGVTAF